MKKSIVILVFIVFAIPSFLKAQLFVGGNISYSGTGGNYEGANAAYDLTKTSSINFGPMAGYYLNQDFAAGIRLTLNLNKQTTPPFLPEGDETINKQTTLGFVPFLRYHFLRFNKFSAFAQGQASVSVGSEKTITGDTEDIGPKVTTFGIRLFPGIAFDVSDNFVLEAQINGFGLGYTISTRKTENESTTNKTTNTSGYFGVTLDNLATTGAISIGAIYKF